MYIYVYQQEKSKKKIPWTINWYIESMKSDQWISPIIYCTTHEKILSP